MKKFRDQPLARKALMLGVVPSVFAVLFLALASVTFTYFRVKGSTVVDLQGQASIVKPSLASALIAGDRPAASATLESLQVRPNINVACLFDGAGGLFAGHGRNGYSCPATLSEANATFGTSMLLREAISLGPADTATLIVNGNLNRFYQWVRILIAAVTFSLVGGMLAGFGLTYRLQQAVLSPILELARTADAVTATRDYSLRAVKVTNDEVGGLVESFNSMLDELQSQNEALTVEIVERKRAEELKDAFLAAVSHELRTPLNAILGRVQLLRLTKPTDERLERSLESLERNARSQARLVEDLLDVSRIVSGKFHLNVDVVDLRNVVAHAVEVATPQAVAAATSIEVTVPETPCLVSGDDDRLQQAVLNLLSNGVKFGGGHPVALTLRAEPVSGTYEILVRDSGIGIAQEFLPNVFDRFRQADTSMTRVHGGLGLGLAIVKEVADLHNGSVTAYSGGAGHGATFTLTMPQLIEADSSRSVTPGRPAWEPVPVQLPGVRLLVVDDDPDGLDIAATALTSAGATVARATGGLEAVVLWEEGGFDAIVCDLAMPGMDGFQVLDQIIQHDRRFGRLPAAVALTAYASNEHRARSLAAGFTMHLAKPYSTADLVDAVSDALDARGMARGQALSAVADSARHQSSVRLSPSSKRTSGS